MSTVFVKATGAGCIWFAEYYFEVPDVGSAADKLREAEVRYEQRFGKFESSYCEQCFDWTYLTFELLNRKQGRRLLCKLLTDRESLGDAEVFRL